MVTLNSVKFTLHSSQLVYYKTSDTVSLQCVILHIAQYVMCMLFKSSYRISCNHKFVSRYEDLGKQSIYVDYTELTCVKDLSYFLFLFLVAIPKSS